MLKGIDKDLIVEHRLIISFFFFLYLLQEELFLHEGVIELSIRITELMVLNEELEPFSESRFGSMILGKWRHHLGVLNDEGRVKALRLQESSDEFIDESNGGAWIGAIYFVLLALLVKENLCFFGLEVLGDGFSEFLLELLHHGNTSPGRSEVDIENLIRVVLWVWVVIDDVAASDLLHH